MRLDQYLVKKGLASTRSKASQLIKSQNVLVNGKMMSSKGYEVKEKDTVSLKENSVLRYVSRGGHKLEKAIASFRLDFTGKVIADIGASTGGFTDCALQHGAKKVYAIDVGTAQLSQKLRDDTRVVVMENTNFRYIDKAVFQEKVDYYVSDVSFISIKEIIKTLLSFSDPFTLVLLFKPQFEVGRENINDHGVVKSIEALKEALSSFMDFLKEKRLHLLGFTYSPIKGNKEGNIEFLLEVSTAGKDIPYDLEKTIREARENLD